MEFKIGDKVTLKSGGPVMTVESDEGSGRLLCTWFDGKKKLQDGFDSRALKLSSGRPDREMERA